MGWFNYYGLIIMAIIMIPNIIFAITHRGEAGNTFNTSKQNGKPFNNETSVTGQAGTPFNNTPPVSDQERKPFNKTLSVLEQVARFGCFVFMVFNIPYTWIGFYITFGKYIYLIVNGVLLFAYCLVWVILKKSNGIVKALSLSILPSLIFLFSGVMIASIPLIVSAILFAVAHIWISVKCAKEESPNRNKRKGIITVVAILMAFVLTFVSTYGGIIFYQEGQLEKLNKMSAQDMINYCCTGDTKISVAIIQDGTISTHTYGANGEEQTIYDYEIGSISKTYVGLLCAKAVEEGKLNLSDSISKYLDLNDGKYYPTIERLLTHTSGYKGYYYENSMAGNEFAHIQNDFYGIGRDKILKRVKTVTLEDKDYPFNYSNFGISVVGLVLEQIYNDSFTNILNDYIQNDLKLFSTVAAKQSGNLTGYWKWKEDDGYIPAGSIISNIEDMSKYLNMYLTDSIPYASSTYIKLKELNATPSTNAKVNVRVDSIGMTWILDEQNGFVWHNGATTNFNSYMGFTKDKKRGVVLLSNLNSNDKISMTVIGAKLLLEK